MEKKHGWEYIRSKGKDKNAIRTPRATPKTPAEAYSSAEASPALEQMTMMDSPGPSSGYSSGYHNAGASTNNLYPGLFPRAMANQNMADFDFNASALYPQGQLGLDTAGVNNNVAGSYQAYPTPASLLQQQFSPHTPAYSTITPSPMITGDHHVPSFYHGSMAASDAGQVGAHQMSNHYDAQFEGQNNHFSLSGLDNGFDFGNMDMSTGDDFQLITSNTGAFTQPNSGDVTLFPMMPQLDEDMSLTAADFASLDNTNDFEDPLEEFGYL